MKRSDEFAEGYRRAMAEWERDGDWWGMSNPFPEGTDRHAGYEEAAYDLTEG